MAWDMYMYVCIYSHTHTHTYIHTYIHTYMHAYIHACMHTYIHTYIHTCIAFIHTCMHTCTYIHTYVPSLIFVSSTALYSEFLTASWTPYPESLTFSVGSTSTQCLKQICILPDSASDHNSRNVDANSDVPISPCTITAGSIEEDLGKQWSNVCMIVFFPFLKIKIKNTGKTSYMNQFICPFSWNIFYVLT